MAPLDLFFESDPAKARSNLRKHRVSFEEAASVFFDPSIYTDVDAEHSENDQRFSPLAYRIVNVCFSSVIMSTVARYV